MHWKAQGCMKSSVCQEKIDLTFGKVVIKNRINYVKQNKKIKTEIYSVLILKIEIDRS